MGYITLTAITWVTPPSSAKLCTIKHRLTADPDIPASYVTDSGSYLIAIDGTLSPPLNITGLSDETSYTVKINSNCGGASAVAEFTTGMVCPDISDISGVGNAGSP